MVSHHLDGRVEAVVLNNISKLLADLRRHSGGAALHRITQAATGGHHFLTYRAVVA